MGVQLAGKIVLVTGAAGGVGRVVAAQMAAEGAKTVLLADLAPEPLTEVATAIEAVGASVGVIVADLGSAEGCADLVTRVADGYGRLDVLVHTAAVPNAPVDFLSVPDQVWASEIALHLNASFYLGRGFAAVMAGTGGGSLFFTGSIATQGGARGMAGYTAAKTGLLGLVRAMAVELAPRGIRVNMVSPGAVDTPRYRRRITDDEAMTRLRDHFPPAPLDRIATPNDVAAAFAFLASDSAGYITGQNLMVDGGTSVWMRTPND
jgi:NAD(P)-dependent dehydrogenase (short-subunit alcohol dehydrogenase family)